MATELEELIQFLSSPSPQLRKAAIDIVQGLTGSEDGLQSLAKYPDVLLPSLARLLREQKDVAERAAEALVNLSQNSDLAGKMIDLGLIGEAMNLLYNVDSSISQLLVMLLVNLTQLDAGIASLLQTGDDKMQGLYVMKIVRSFCRSASESSDDPFEHVASILVNISKKEAGRKLLLDPNRGLLKQIIRQYDSNSQLRKNGVFGTLRNCCFEAEDQLQNLLLIAEFLWPALLLPVAAIKRLHWSCILEREEMEDAVLLNIGLSLAIWALSRLPTLSNQYSDYNRLGSVVGVRVFHFKAVTARGFEFRSWWFPSPLGLKFRSPLSGRLSTPSNSEEGSLPSAAFCRCRLLRNAAREHGPLKDSVQPPHSDAWERVGRPF
ncbi:protein HGH1-like protein isoform X2 [Cucumis melo var. makuwa]|uniref:Protein HGH1-like protein isoform X2 n=1 Tax=Cucumis melo var. makuwa TaxID=1194695 RepID=A0A5D3CBK5_CUCMM|nr:protein HGH1-like protein isoform X2 [Cucumis melo var. makuwa]